MLKKGCNGFVEYTTAVFQHEAATEFQIQKLCSEMFGPCYDSLGFVILQH